MNEQSNKAIENYHKDLNSAHKKTKSNSRVPASYNEEPEEEIEDNQNKNYDALSSYTVPKKSNKPNKFNSPCDKNYYSIMKSSSPKSNNVAENYKKGKEENSNEKTQNKRNKNETKGFPVTVKKPLSKSRVQKDAFINFGKRSPNSKISFIERKNLFPASGISGGNNKNKMIIK